ncbi:uncharacterized protein LOC105664521 [Ceratitis capitata]|uniref:uncharacterized protein LOC105664521 n=1 Tax=Ceratitis capitata TaxID=7213 RepID=UPI000A0FB209|nr:uncharacterized protein LOC105664521 [Ceratitis capitata]
MAETESTSLRILSAMEEIFNMVRANNNSKQQPKEQHRCPVCNHNHRLLFCRQMRRLEPAERLRAVLLHRHCANCLSPNHMANNCSSRRNCDRCQERHHSLLHLWGTDRSEVDVPPVGDVIDHRSKRRHCPYRAQALPDDSSNDEVLEIDASDDEVLEQPPNEQANTPNPPLLRPPLSSVRFVVQRSHPPSEDRSVSSSRRNNKLQRRPRAVRDARERIKGPARSALGMSVLTPTVMVSVVASGRGHPVRALIDPGQSRSSISRTLARRLHLLPREYAESIDITLKGWRDRISLTASIRR